MEADGGHLPFPCEWDKAELSTTAARIPLKQQQGWLANLASYCRFAEGTTSCLLFDFRFTYHVL